ncbi:MAG: ABC transporter ATP-binding protein [bacterium]|nr:ABC transporter ATP-binding protein [bacterium]
MSRKEYIRIVNARMGYKKPGHTVDILHRVNLSFYAGDLVGIVGLNGVGKSTLLRSICGLLPLLEGEVVIEGREIRELSIEDLARKIAVVLTEKIGGFNLTLFDVVAAGQIPYTDSFHRLTNENRSIINSAIDRCGIKSFTEKPVTELSDGLFQKTMIAKALAQQTPILLFDEPSAFLDYASKHDLFSLLQELTHKEGKCVVVSSHELEILLKYCTKLLVISPNGVELISREEARQNAAFIQLTGGFL